MGILGFVRIGIKPLVRTLNLMKHLENNNFFLLLAFFFHIKKKKKQISRRKIFFFKYFIKFMEDFIYSFGVLYWRFVAI